MVTPKTCSKAFEEQVVRQGVMGAHQVDVEQDERAFHLVVAVSQKPNRVVTGGVAAIFRAPFFVQCSDIAVAPGRENSEIDPHHLQEKH